MKISRRHFIKTSVAVSALGLTTAAKSKTKQPNLLIVFPDQMRAQTLGFLKEDPVITPRLDQFAKESLVLPHAVSNRPVCSPFRAMLMTGQYPHANNVLTNSMQTMAKYKCELRKSARCWSDVLKDEGYSLGYIGKWHLDIPHEPYIDCYNNKGDVKWNEWCPPDRRHGFDFWYSYGTYDAHMKPMYWSTNAKRNEFKFVDQWGPEHEADLAIKYIKNEDGSYRKNKKPFALVVSMNPPHGPYNQFPEKYLKPYEGKTSRDLLAGRPNVDKSGKTKMSKLALGQTKNYYANVTGVDDQFGRILDAIKGAGLEEDTIILFTSDHGNCLGIHNEKAKTNPFEESMRIPFIVRWPGKIKPRHDDLLISVPDIYPTLLDLMNLEDEIPNEVQGTSYAKLFLTGKGPRPSSQLYMYAKPDSPAYGKRGVRTHRYKLVITKNTADSKGNTELYDMKEDPFELTNIAQENPDIVKKLTYEELKPWLKKATDPWIKNL